ncbi:terminase large subunit [Aliamphritea hakodatensis]|uniref:terminase large subunit n=1 Tax=Aliamphritea hakodatensis TaxID=2895352 RepID=UPI0022FD6387|nr:terminase TerL endonuclease subunit [Aliamphritea hakodatensis]
MASYPNVNAANKYARDIVACRIPACRWVYLACKRHLDDLEKAKQKKYPYKFDKAKAERICSFLQKLPHTKGKWARERRKLVLEPWQLFRYAAVFGWVNKKTGFRRFKESYNEIPRKNGKSAEAAGVGLYLFAADGEFGAEVYCGATTEHQAWKVFEPARIMCLRTPDLVSRFGIEINARNLNILADNSKFEPLIGDPGDGGSPSGAIIDEYHEHRTASLYDTMATGMGARENPLILIITTGGNNIASPCYAKRKEVEQVLEGVIQDDELFGIIYTIDPDDDWKDPKSLIKANPNFGVSVTPEYLQSQLRKALNNPRTAASFKTKHLNMWGGAANAFFNLEHWDQCADTSLRHDQFRGEDLFLGIDLASKLDLTAAVSVYSRLDDAGRRHYYCISPYFWIPEDTVFESEDDTAADRYKAWVETGHLTATDGAEIDYLYILDEMKSLNGDGQIEEVGMDPHGAAMLSHRLSDENIEVVSIVQNFTNMSDPMKELEAALKSGRFHHDGNPVLKWCISNVIGKELPGSDDIVRPTKDKATNNKIDGAVGLLMAISRAMFTESSGPKQSVYDRTDVAC